MLVQDNGLHLVDAHVFLAILFEYFLYEGFASLENAFGSEQPDSVDQSIHGDDFIDTVQALRERFCIANGTLSYELRVEFFPLRDLSISQLPLRYASLKNKIAENRSCGADNGPSQGCQNAG